MTAKRTKGLTPTKLLMILSGSIALLLIVAAAGFWFFRGHLVSYAEQVNQASQNANISSNDIAKLQKLETQLKEDSVAVTRTKNIVADSQSYQYQNQIISDINAYAKASGITVSGYSFISDMEAAAAAGVTPQTVAPAGLKSTSVSVGIKNPVDYRAAMKFIHSIEVNLTKMQLTGISMTRAEKTDQVVVSPLTIEVYIR